MSDLWQYQIRATLTEAAAALARTDPAAPALRPLTEVLARHGATLACQLDAFQDYVSEAEKAGPETFPLYRWTKATLADPEKRSKHAQAFALRLSGEEVYGRNAADALEAALLPFVGGDLVLRISRHDTNPANNLAIPAEYRP